MVGALYSVQLVHCTDKWFRSPSKEMYVLLRTSSVFEHLRHFPDKGISRIFSVTKIFYIFRGPGKGPNRLHGSRA